MSVSDVDDTIVAIASASGGAARGVVRLSGPRAVSLLASSWTPADPSQALPGNATRVVSGLLGVPTCGSVPAQLFLWPTRRSYTRQPTVEIHTLGSPPVLDALVVLACEQGARLARPGEFTLRAFLAGRIDLMQAEAVLGVIDAQNETAMGQALRQLAGGLSRPLHALRSQLLDLCADLEAGLDFADEDIAFISPQQLQARLDEAIAIVLNTRRQLRDRSSSHEVPRVALWGLANVGKSSLMNAVVRHATALVSDRAGTTRDYLTQRLESNGLKWDLVDTPGIQSQVGMSPIDLRAQELAAELLTHVPLRLLCIDGTREPEPWEHQQCKLVASRPDWLVVLTKCDQGVLNEKFPDAIVTSSHTGRGLDQLTSRVAETLRQHAGDAVASTAARCGQALDAAAESLDRARQLAVEQRGEELVAAELRVVLDRMAAVVGAVYTNDLLDRIFSRFCIGK